MVFFIHKYKLYKNIVYIKITTNYVGLYRLNDPLTGDPFSPINNNNDITILGITTIYLGLLIKAYSNFNVQMTVETNYVPVTFYPAIPSNQFIVGYTNNEQGVFSVNGIESTPKEYTSTGSAGYVIPIKIEFSEGLGVGPITLTFSGEGVIFSYTNTPTPTPTPTYTVSPSRTVKRLIIVNGTPTIVSSKIQKKSNIIVQNNTNTGTTNKEVVLSDKYIIYKLYDEVVDGLIETPDTLPG